MHTVVDAWGLHSNVLYNPFVVKNYETEKWFDQK
jgi:hypothetical protein